MRIKTGSDFSGVGAFDQALSRLGIEQDKLFACDMDKYARQTYCLNFGTEKDIELSKLPMAGNLQVALAKSIPELSKIMRQAVNPTDFSFYYPENVYDREIPTDSLDIYMTSPPCQGYSLAGKRDGSILFFNSLEFIQKNKPRYFIFENVKGLLSHDKVEKTAEYGRTFQEWVNHLGGKSINGVHNFFPIEDSVPYHIYFQVLNAKHYGVPQNRERIFIVGIRDDADNEFSFPKPFHLVKRLRDVLEPEVDEKYFLSEKMVAGLIREGDKAYINQNTQASQVFSEYGESPSICAGTHGYANGYVELSDEIIQLNDRIYSDEGISPTLNTMQGGNRQPFVQLSEVKPVQIGKSEKTFAAQNGTLVGKEGQEAFCIRATNSNGVLVKNRIRKLTPTECFRLMDFEENFQWNVSDSQAYKQAGNSIVVNCLVEIIKKLKL